MTSKQQNIMALQNLADELGLFYSYLNNSPDGIGGELVFTLNLTAYKETTFKPRFIIKQWFFLCAYVTNDGKFKVRSKICYPGIEEKENFYNIEEVRQYILDYMRYTKEHLVDMKLERIKWDFDD